MSHALLASLTAAFSSVVIACGPEPVDPTGDDLGETESTESGDGDGDGDGDGPLETGLGSS